MRTETCPYPRSAYFGGMRRFSRLLVLPAGDGIVITDVDATNVRVKFAIPGSQAISVGCMFDPADPNTQIVCGGTSVTVNAGAETTTSI